MAVPSDFAGLVAWHEGSGQPEADGLTTSQLIGLYGTANGQVQTDATRCPVMATTGGARNMQFDASNDRMLLNAGIGLTSGDYTIFVKFASRSTGAVRRTVSGTYQNWLIGARSDFGTPVRNSHYNGGFIVDSAVVTGAIHTHTVKRVSGISTYYIDGYPIGSNANTSSPGVLSVGDYAFNEPCDSDVYAVGAYNVALSDINQQAIEAYLGVVFLPTNMRLTQLAPEVVAGANSKIDLSQLAVEAVGGATSNIRVTQHAIEAVAGAQSNIEVTQFCIEVVYALHPPQRMRVYVI